MKRQIVINGKFLRAEMTGVHRVAVELVNALADLKAEGDPAAAAFDFAVWHSRDGIGRAADLRLPTRCLPQLEGIAWEQVTLPAALPRDALLLNLCNIGPMATARAVTMIHDAQVHIAPASYSRAFRLWYRFVQPVLCARNRALLTVSDYSRGQIAAAGLCPTDRISVVHNGGDHILRTPAEAGALDVRGLAPHRYVVALASTQPHKNIRVLVDAFRGGGAGSVRLVLVGGAGRKDFAAAGMTASDDVLFAGRVSDGSLRALLEQALCLAFPSTTEGFGLPPLEAMTLGCPVLAVHAGAVPEVCGGAAHYLPPHDAAAWRHAIGALCDPASIRAGLVEAGRARSERFTWRNSARMLCRILTALPE